MGLPNNNEFPSNDGQAKMAPETVQEQLSDKQGPEPDQAEPVVGEGTAIRRKKTLGKRFKDALFTTDDGMSLHDYVLFEVLVPSAKKMFVDAVWNVVTGFGQGFEQKLTGMTTPTNASQRGMNTTVQSTVRTNYNGMSRPSTVRVAGANTDQQRISRRARAQHDFDELEFPTRQDATLVLEQMYDRLERFSNVSVADFYSFANLRGEHTDEIWGWTNLHSAGVVPIRNGNYIISLPRPVPLN